MIVDMPRPWHTRVARTFLHVDVQPTTSSSAAATPGEGENGDGERCESCESEMAASTDGQVVTERLVV